MKRGPKEEKFKRENIQKGTHEKVPEGDLKEAVNDRLHEMKRGREKHKA